MGSVKIFTIVALMLGYIKLDGTCLTRVGVHTKYDNGLQARTLGDSLHSKIGTTLKTQTHANNHSSIHILINLLYKKGVTLSTDSTKS